VLEAIAAMGRVIAADPDASGVVIGSGPLEPDVRAAVASTGMGRIAFLGQLTDQEVIDQLWLAEVMLVPSAFEGLGLVALEAMAAGVAVVGYDVIGLRDTIGPLGRLVPSGDVGGLANEARALLGDEPGRLSMTSKAFSTVRRERSWSANAAALEEVFADVTGR
jgi:glycosyltransferase involved in cell wall biosynthesis